MARIQVEPCISYDDTRQLYYVSMELARSPGGGRSRYTRTYRDLEEARTQLREFLLRRRLDPAHARPMTLGEWLERWMDTVVRPTRAETTVYGYQNIVDRHLCPLLGEIPLSALTAQHIQDYYLHAQRSRCLSASTVRRHHDLLSAALRAAVRQELLPLSPMDRVEPPRPRPHEARFYTPDQLRRLYALLEGSALELPVRLAGSLGLRREELCGLTWRCIDLPRQLLRVCQARTTCGSSVVEKETKNRASVRTLSLPPELAALLTAARAGKQPEDYVICNRRGQPYSPNALSLAFTRFVAGHGLPKITLHGLRHSFATAASVQGVPLFDIGKALGHATPATTGRIYTHLVDHTHRETVLQVAQALEGIDKREFSGLY